LIAAAAGSAAFSYVRGRLTKVEDAIPEIALIYVRDGSSA